MNRLWVYAIALCAPAFLTAQVIPLQTAPFFGSDQLVYFPATNLKAAGISIAVDDAAADQFINPACGLAIRGLTVFTVPTFVAIGKSAETSMLSLGVRYGDDTFYGGMYGGQQHAKDRKQDNVLVERTISGGASGTNEFGHAFVGYRFPETGTTLGVSFFRATIGFLAKFNSIGLGYGDLERGGSNQYKFGIEQRLEGGGRLDVVAARAVTSVDYQYTPPYDGGPVLFGGAPPPSYGHDRSATWAIQSHYVQPVSNSLFLGALADINWKQFDQLSLFESPARATAFQFGLGVSRAGAESVVGCDVVYEPASITLSRWQGLPNDDIVRLNSTVRFSNWTGKVGLRTDRKPLALSFGLQLHVVQFHVNEQDQYERIYADSNEGWNEWRFTIGLTARVFEMELDYTGILTTFKHPDAVAQVTTAETSSVQSFIDIIRPYYGASFTDANSILHRLALTVPVF